MKLLGLLPALTLAACTSSTTSHDPPSSQSSERAYRAASNRLEAAVRSLGNVNVAPVVGSISGSAPCSLGGDVSLSGTYDTDGTNTSIDLSASFDACEETEGTLDGSLDWTSRITETTVTDIWKGSLDFTDAYGTWTCVFDMTTIVDSTGVHYSGSLCGYDVEADLGL